MKPFAPEPLDTHHKIDTFACGEPVLDEWLKRRAMSNQSSGASRSFVVTDKQGLVRGYYAMAAGAVARQIAPRALRQNMPYPIAVMVLARLAVDREAQGMQLGAALLKDAVQRALLVTQNAGVRALLVHALHDTAKQFYQQYGLTESPVNPLTLMLHLGKT